jgi:dihydrofolate reductase
MRKITAGLFISLDGVVEDPQNWHFPYFNDEMGAAVDSQLAAADTLLLGRKTYDSFAGAWPDREAAGEEDAAMGKALGDARKIVVSNQNLQFTWRKLRATEGRSCRGGHRAEERAWRNGYRNERIHLNRPAAAGCRSP